MIKPKIKTRICGEDTYFYVMVNLNGMDIDIAFPVYERNLDNAEFIADQLVRLTKEVYETAHYDGARSSLNKIREALGIKDEYI